jgi:hypothetical protein
MSLLSKSNFELGLKYPKKFLFTNVKTFVSKNKGNSFLKSLLFSLAMLLFLSSCEQKNIDTEIGRLQSLEKELNKSISEKNIERAKLICIQMKWEYVATTVGADVKCEKLAEIWDDKRRNYLKIIGIDHVEILGEKPKPKPKPKTFEERFFDNE